VLAKVRELVVPEMERHGPIEAWIIERGRISTAERRHHRGIRQCVFLGCLIEV